MADDPTVDDRVETTRFGHLDITFDPHVLRPREWTRAQSEWAASLLDEVAEGPVLELCTGAGQIGLLAIAGSGRRLVAVDANERAVHFARANARAAGLDSQVEVRLARLETALSTGETFPLIIADPPWVESEGVAALPEDPVLAIDGGSDGLDIARLCATVIGEHLAPGGAAIMQLGSRKQAEALGTELEKGAGLGAADLHLFEVREFERGALVRLGRR